MDLPVRITRSQELTRNAKNEVELSEKKVPNRFMCDKMLNDTTTEVYFVHERRGNIEMKLLLGFGCVNLAGCCSSLGKVVRMTISSMRGGKYQNEVVLSCCLNLFSKRLCAWIAAFW